jgi:hypothetical protein
VSAVFLFPEIQAHLELPQKRKSVLANRVMQSRVGVIHLHERLLFHRLEVPRNALDAMGRNLNL